MARGLYRFIHNIIGVLSLALLLLGSADFGMAQLDRVPPWRENDRLLVQRDSATGEHVSTEPTDQPLDDPRPDQPVRTAVPTPQGPPPDETPVAPVVPSNYFDLGGKQEPELTGFHPSQRAAGVCRLDGIVDQTTRAPGRIDGSPFTTATIPVEPSRRTVIGFCFDPQTTDDYFEIWLGGVRPESLACAGTPLYVHTATDDEVRYREFLIPAECVASDEIILVFMNLNEGSEVRIYGFLVMQP